jgi:para-aminobenzoate synthetase component 1
MRYVKEFHLDDPVHFKRKALRWAEGFRCFQYLEGNDLPYLHGSFPSLLALSNAPSEIIRVDNASSAFGRLLEKKGWWFGYLGYGYANPLYHAPTLGFEMGEWFRPECLLSFPSHHVLKIESNELPDLVFERISQYVIEEESLVKVKVQAEHSKERYIHLVEQLKKHLFRGNIYQVNFCTRFESDDAVLKPVEVYEKLNSISATPFSSLLKLGNKYILCASPERYLKKQKTKVISQPMKGTAPRGKDPQEDALLAQGLAENPKERAENIMIVDLVRNDLSRVCLPGSVEVEALCEVRSFVPVHQMISTVVGEMGEGQSAEELIQATFPMGSMTGAPKIRAMELIHEFESSARGPFSGALGYVDPAGDFDLNVIIRSIFYNAQSHQLSYSVGSGITVLSDSEKEYEECLLKAKIIGQVLGSH